VLLQRAYHSLLLAGRVRGPSGQSLALVGKGRATRSSTINTHGTALLHIVLHYYA